MAWAVSLLLGNRVINYMLYEICMAQEMQQCVDKKWLKCDQTDGLVKYSVSSSYEKYTISLSPLNCCVEVYCIVIKKNLQKPFISI